MKKLESLSTLEEGDRTVLRELKERIRRFVPSATVLLYGKPPAGPVMQRLTWTRWS